MSNKTEKIEKGSKLTINADLLAKLNKANVKSSTNNVTSKSIYNFAFFFALALKDKQVQKKFRSFFRRFKFAFVCSFLTAIKEQTATKKDFLLQFIFIKTFFVDSSLSLESFTNAKKEKEQTEIYSLYLSLLADYKKKNEKEVLSTKADLQNTAFAKVTEHINYLSKLVNVQ